MVKDLTQERPKSHAPELSRWLQEGGDEERELLIEASVQRRKVSFEGWPRRRRAASAMEGTSGQERAQVLGELETYARETLGLAPTVLSAAGVLAVRAKPNEARRLLDHPLVRSISPNRRLSAR
jgi:hypothetical protein